MTELQFQNISKMKIQKRNGTFQDIDLNKIKNRIEYLVLGFDPNGNKIGEKLESIDPLEIAIQVIYQIVDKIKSSELDELTAEICAYKNGENIEYGILADRIIISNHHKNTEKTKNFSNTISALYENCDIHGEHAPLISEKFYKVVMNPENRFKLDSIVNARHIKDYSILDYFGFKTLEKSYLLKAKYTTNSKIIQVKERYQHLLMRVALSMYLDDIDKAIETYTDMSDGFYTHATPTMFNAGTPRQQLSSCFLIGIQDSIEGMYENARKMSHISKWAGGIGVHLSKIRSQGTKIRSTNGESTGILPYIKVLNELARHVNQGGKRKGSIAVYLTPFHADIFPFLELKRNSGKEELRARDLFYALFIPDLFMKRVKSAIEKKSTVMWSLFCPDEAPGLEDVYGEEFEELYTRYETEGKYKQQVDILKLWGLILDIQQETSGPYMIYSDNVNLKSNQKNIGMIKSSNLCAEITLYSDHEEYAVCNLASINLKRMLEFDSNIETDMGIYIGMSINYERLRKITHSIVRNLNRVIDENYYPVKETARSNFKHRPIGIGVQGLADVFFKLRVPFESNEAREINRKIFETIYLSAVEMSIQLAREHTELLSKVNLEELILLKRHSSAYLYYKEYFDNFLMKDKDINRFTIHEKQVHETNYENFQMARQSYEKLIHKYGLPDNPQDYQNLNLSPDTLQYLGAYSSYIGSPASQGLLQYDLEMMYSKQDKYKGKEKDIGGSFLISEENKEWERKIKEDLKKYGMRNSKLISLMPTASSAAILGNNECFEPLISNIFTKQVLSGSFIIVNKYLQNDLQKLGLWSTEMKEKILLHQGSIMNIPEIPQEYRELYKIAFEIKTKAILNLAIDRSPFIDQSQSLNVFVDDPSPNILTAIHMYGWGNGLKTGMYYLRRRTHVDPQKFSVDINTQLKLHSKERKENEEEKSSGGGVFVCDRKNPDCIACQG